MGQMIWKGLRLPQDVVEGIDRQAKAEHSNWCLVARRILTLNVRKPRGAKDLKGQLRRGL